MKIKCKILFSVVLIITLICSMLTFVGCDKTVYTTMSRAKELVQSLDELPSSYGEMDEINGKNEKEYVVERSKSLCSSNVSVQSDMYNIEIEDVPNGDFSNSKFEDFIVNDYYVYHADSIFMNQESYIKAVSVIKYYKEIALETVKQLSIWVEGASQKYDKYMSSVLKISGFDNFNGLFGDFYVSNPTFRINYDVNSDIVTLECKGNYAGVYAYIKAYCSYNENGKIVISALMQSFTGDCDIVPFITINNIYYEEDECMAVKHISAGDYSYSATNSKEDYYKACDELHARSNAQYFLVDFKSGCILENLRQNWMGTGYGRNADYITKLNDLFVVASLYEIDGVECASKYDDEYEKYSPYDKRVEELFLLDNAEKALAVIDSKKALISTSTSQEQREIINQYIDIQQFAAAEILGVSSLASAVEFVDSTITVKNIEGLPAKEMFSIMEEPAIDRKKQSVDNEIFALLHFNVTGKVLIDRESGEIDLSNISAMIPQSILLTEGADYSLVVALRSANELLDLCDISMPFDGQTFEIKLSGVSVDCKQIMGYDDYVLVAYIAKESDDGRIRLSDFYILTAETSMQYNETWKETLEEDTRCKTFDYTFEIISNDQNIIISKYFMISFSPKQ